MSKYQGEIKERINIARSFGYVLIRERKHLVFQHPNGHQVVMSKTSSCPRSMKNVVSLLKRGSKGQLVS